MISWLWNSVSTRVLLYGSAALAVVSALAAVRGIGVNAERVHRLKKELKADEPSREIEDDIRCMSSDRVLNELRDKWSR